MALKEEEKETDAEIDELLLQFDEDFEIDVNDREISRDSQEVHGKSMQVRIRIIWSNLNSKKFMISGKKTYRISRK